MRNYKFAIVLVTIYLVVFTVAGKLGAPLGLMLLMFFFSPLLLAWMVYSVLKYGKHSGKTLKEGEEWGYEDKIKK